MPALVGSTLDFFCGRLAYAERHASELDQWEQRFVSDMRERFEIREDQLDLGLQPWNPSVNQYNTLFEIAERLGFVHDSQT